VLDAVTREDGHGSAVEPDRHRHRQRPLGEAEHFGDPGRNAGRLERAVELAESGPEERIVELGRKRSRGTLRFGDPGHAASLLRVVEGLDDEHEPVPADDADTISFVSARVAPRLPELAVEPNLTQRAAGLGHCRHRSDQRLRADLNSPAARNANPEGSLRELEHRSDGHEHDPPWTWNEEEGSDERGNQEHDAASSGSMALTRS
jgi:hypothetical protein